MPAAVMKKEPSEYWAKNCFASGAMDIRAGYDAGTPILMFGADIPHSEGDRALHQEALRLLLQAEECGFN
jgi:hypothetical protein